MRRHARVAGPLIAGTLKDALAPQCAVVEVADGVRSLDPSCATSAASQRGLLIVVVAVVGTFAISGALWVLAAVATCRQASRGARGELL